MVLTDIVHHRNFFFSFLDYFIFSFAMYTNISIHQHYIDITNVRWNIIFLAMVMKMELEKKTLQMTFILFNYCYYTIFSHYFYLHRNQTSVSSVTPDTTDIATPSKMSSTSLTDPENTPGGSLSTVRACVCVCAMWWKDLSFDEWY